MLPAGNSHEPKSAGDETSALIRSGNCAALLSLLVIVAVACVFCGPARNQREFRLRSFQKEIGKPAAIYDSAKSTADEELLQPSTTPIITLTTSAKLTTALTITATITPTSTLFWYDENFKSETSQQPAIDNLYQKPIENDTRATPNSTAITATITPSTTPISTLFLQDENSKPKPSQQQAVDNLYQKPIENDTRATPTSTLSLQHENSKPEPSQQQAIDNLNQKPVGNNTSTRTVLSSATCDDAHGPYARNCKFHNLYWMNRSFWLFVLEESNISLEYIKVMLTGSDYVDKKRQWSARDQLRLPNLKRFKNLKDIEAYVSKLGFQLWNGVTLMFHLERPGHLIHSLFEGFYDAFISLVRAGLNDRPFRPLISFADVPLKHKFGISVRGVLGELGGFEVQNLKRDLGPIVMEVAVTGHRFTDCDQGVGWCPRHRDGTPALFRNRALGTFGVPKNRGHEQQITVIDSLNMDDRDKRIVNLKSITSFRSIGGMAIEYIDLLQLPTLRSQLMLMHKTAVHVSEPGSGSFYIIFLHDGSVHVNLGRMNYEPRHPPTKYVYVNFMEENLAETASYVRTFYYDTNLRLCGVMKPDLMNLLQRAVNFYRAGFPIPVPPGENLWRHPAREKMARTLARFKEPKSVAGYPIMVGLRSQFTSNCADTNHAAL
eukprot:gnl/MRDRNA2_/MRDRNA2_64288_c0_seq1.p1 gnl/MRDRNA2_/MRDRNA2_64288_c0~~gnl/MRDRNA2_/MRDRNA2_64288_c0_seq1.p1  ORF type:complete len:662 (+),score=77.30 gnl/MRDRNA2_/MRDRNA2_64288_c0_seq1:91-2076(+)